MPAAERELVLVAWNATVADFPSNRCLHELFEDRAVKAPEAIALVSGTESLSYAELNARANRLAHMLVASGVQSGDSVAVALGRSIGLVVAEVAILKAGGMYVPLDMALPGSRQAMMVEDCGAKVLVTESLGALPVEISPGMTRIQVDGANLIGTRVRAPRYRSWGQERRRTSCTPQDRPVYRTAWWCRTGLLAVWL